MLQPEDKRKIRVGILIAAFSIAMYLCFQNLDVVGKVIGGLLGLLSPFLYGVCFAFVLNQLMRFLEKSVFDKLNRKKSPKWGKFRRSICLTATVLIALGILAGLISYLIPQVGASIMTLVNNMSGYLTSLQEFANNILSSLGFSADIIETITDFLTQFSDRIFNFLGNLAPKLVETTISITSGIINVFFGFIVAIYMLATKESLVQGCKRIVYAFLPKRGADYLQHAYTLANQRFSGFVSGQLTEAVILGILCFIGMKIFGMEYALLISIIIGVTNIIPIIGPILGTVPGALIMLMIEPIKALWFVIFIIVLQQIESNLIYPKVVGDSIGLPGLWVIFAVLVGGSLFGLPGVILGVPSFAVIYTLIAEAVDKRLREKQLKV